MSPAGGGAAALTMRLTAMGSSFHVELRGLTTEQAQVVVDAWSGCEAHLVPPPAMPPALVAELTDGAPSDDVDLARSDVAVLSESLTVRITRRLIEDRRSDSLLLHAAALADPVTGRVVALVGPSGRGKTTAALRLGRRFAYVTDETVPVARDGSVAAYGKPLSLKPASGSAPKRQASPTSLGLAAPPRTAELSLGALVLLDRRPDVREAWIEDVPLEDAVAELLPEISFLGGRADPLRHLLAVVAAAGGVRRLVYTEAADLEALVTDLLQGPAQDGAARPASVPDRAVPVVVAQPEEPCWARGPHDDAVDVGPDVLVLARDRVFVLRGVGAAVWRCLGAPAGTSDVVAGVVGALGPGPDGQARGLVEDALRTLGSEGLVTLDGGGGDETRPLGPRASG